MVSQKKIDEFEIFLNNLEINFDVIGLTETHLNSVSERYTSIKDYKSFFNSRRKRSWGGVALLLQPHLTCKHRPDLDVFLEGVLESLFVEITDKGKNVIIGVVYRPPNSDTTVFCSKINEILSKIKNEKLHLMGDFNLDLLKSEQHQPTADFLNDLSGKGLQPLISLPTRITSVTSTIIDNIFTNDFYRPISSGLLLTPISDHFPVFTLLGKTGFSTDKRPRYILRRNMGIRNKEKFRSWVEHGVRPLQLAQHQQLRMPLVSEMNFGMPTIDFSPKRK